MDAGLGGGALGRAGGRTVHRSGMQLGGKARFPAAMLCRWAVARAASNVAVYISLVFPLGLALDRRVLPTARARAVEL